MTQPKKVATTLKTVLDHPIMKNVMNRQIDLAATIDEVLSWWEYDLYSRKPGPAYDEDGIFQGTDLDLACFIYSLSDRGASINLPEYKSMRKRTIKEGQVLTSKENRHGNIIGVTSNKNTFTFSVRIKDMNVMKTDSFGDYRNFALTDIDGNWYEGWKKLQFLPTADENKFITENKLWTGNEVIFKNFIHPNRWTSFYGQYYFITKCLIERLREETKYYNNCIKRMLDEGIKYPSSSGEGDKKEEREYGDSKSIKIRSFQVEVDIPENETKYPEYISNEKNLLSLTKLARTYRYKVIPKLSFPVRATELAFYKYGKNNDQIERFPSWLKDVKWERNYKESSRAKKLWDRLVLFQPKVGEKGVSIRKRLYEKTEYVSENY